MNVLQVTQTIPQIHHNLVARASDSRMALGWSYLFLILFLIILVYLIVCIILHYSYKGHFKFKSKPIWRLIDACLLFASVFCFSLHLMTILPTANNYECALEYNDTCRFMNYSHKYELHHSNYQSYKYEDVDVLHTDYHMIHNQNKLKHKNLPNSTKQSLIHYNHTHHYWKILNLYQKPITMYFGNLVLSIFLTVGVVIGLILIAFVLSLVFSLLQHGIYLLLS